MSPFFRGVLNMGSYPNHRIVAASAIFVTPGLRSTGIGLSAGFREMETLNRPSHHNSIQHTDCTRY